MTTKICLGSYIRIIPGLPVPERAPGAGRERGEDEADAESGVADEEELLRQAKVLAAVRQEQRDRDGQPHRHRGDGRSHL